jgi:hypothetical protein
MYLSKLGNKNLKWSQRNVVSPSSQRSDLARNRPSKYCLKIFKNDQLNKSPLNFNFFYYIHSKQSICRLFLFFTIQLKKPSDCSKPSKGSLVPSPEGLLITIFSYISRLSPTDGKIPISLLVLLRFSQKSYEGRCGILG